MEWEHNHNYRVIIDNGSHKIRSGMANSRTPSVIFENMTGKKLFDEFLSYLKQLIEKVVILFLVTNLKKSLLKKNILIQSL